MDPNPGTFPILSYVMSRFPSLASLTTATATSSDTELYDIDIEQPRSEIVGKMPNLADPELIASMGRAIANVQQARSVLNLIGERPTHEDIDLAKAKLAETEAQLSRQLEEIVHHPRPPEIKIQGWRAQQAEKEKECREEAEKEKRIWKSLIQLDEMHEAYEKLLKDSEKRLVRMYDSAGDGDVGGDGDEVNEEVVGILQEADGKGMERIDLSGRTLKILPEAFGRISGLLVLDVSANQLSAIPDSIAGLQNLEELNLSANLLESLPDSIGLLQKLKLLNVSGNKLTALPDSICQCRSLVELDASFNNLSYLPTNIGELDLSNNQIRALPDTFGYLDNLTKLNLEQNPLEVPPVEIVNQGVEAILTFMTKRWIDILQEEERKSNQEMQEQVEGGWLTRSTSWLKNVSGNVAGYIGTAVGSPMSPKSPKEDYLNQQL
ncbi:unnamed protein product [Vicia faba]|uniref:Uncharacterized protein n=1 Tax=Vicia faba TaxID=3906 RepID=A0AAV0ZKB1_VICFA|nr:unnamed protein product [Vicia faba]